jgi:hypothetical protein
MLNAKTADLHACLDPSTTSVKIAVDIAADGSATAKVLGDASDATRACVSKVIASVKFPAKKATASISISR